MHTIEYNKMRPMLIALLNYDPENIKCIEPVNVPNIQYIEISGRYGWRYEKSQLNKNTHLTNYSKSTFAIPEIHTYVAKYKQIKPLLNSDTNINLVEITDHVTQHTKVEIGILHNHKITVTKTCTQFVIKPYDGSEQGKPIKFEAPENIEQFAIPYPFIYAPFWRNVPRLCLYIKNNAEQHVNIASNKIEKLFIDNYYDKYVYINVPNCTKFIYYGDVTYLRIKQVHHNCEFIYLYNCDNYGYHVRHL